MTTEQEMRDADIPWPKTKEELMAFIDTLEHAKDDYGTSVYAMSHAALAAFYYMSHVVGATGFQASCADLDFIRRSRMIKGSFGIRDYNDMLFPQYEYKFDKKISSSTWEWLQEQAKKNIAETENAHPDVLAHWQSIADGVVPFGFVVREE